MPEPSNFVFLKGWDHSAALRLLAPFFATCRATPASLRTLRMAAGRRGVGDQGVELREMAEPHHGAAAELGVVGSQEDLGASSRRWPGRRGLAVIEIEQAAVEIYAADADNAEVHLELVDGVDRRLADDALIATPHQAAGDDHLELGIPAHDTGNIEIIGDHAEPGMVQQGLCDSLGRGADVDEERGVIGIWRATSRAIRVFSSGQSTWRVL